MDVALTTTWNPRGELNRFKRLLPELLKRYASITIILPPMDMLSQAGSSTAAEVKSIPDLRVIQVEDWSRGRHTALSHALSTASSHVQYTDMDRLLRWLETRPDELHTVAARLFTTDCLIVGRTDRAYATHPQALIQTERISNMVVSHFLERQMDVSAGCKGFSRQAAQHLVENGTPGRALGTDAEWPILLHRAGYRLDYLEVDGLDWESADRYQVSAADVDVQCRLAQEYDADPRRWAYRTDVSREIVQVALEAASRGGHGKAYDKK